MEFIRKCAVYVVPIKFMAKGRIIKMDSYTARCDLLFNMALMVSESYSNIVLSTPNILLLTESDINIIYYKFISTVN